MLRIPVLTTNPYPGCFSRSCPPRPQSPADKLRL